MMKNVKVIGYGLWVIGLLLISMPTLARSFDSQELPNNVTFQSTSSMTPVGSVYSSNPTLNEDGTVYNPSQVASPAQAGGGPRKIGPAVDSELDEKDKVPIGDGTWIMMLLVGGYAAVITWKRKAQKKKVLA